MPTEHMLVLQRAVMQCYAGQGAYQDSLRLLTRLTSDLGITKSKILRDSDITEYDQDRERM